MAKIVKLIVLSLVTLVSVNISAKLVTSVEYNGFIYSHGYVSDFQVDGLFYTIKKDGVYVSAERRLLDVQTGVETVVNTTYRDGITFSDGVISIPETVNYGDTIYKVKGIDDEAFKWCYNLCKIEIPNSVEYINALAFFGCNQLKSINIPSSVISIGRDAFYNCINIDSLFWYTPHVSPKIATDHCYNSLKYVLLGDEITSIGDRAFQGCFSLSSIIIPEKVEYIGEAAFGHCVNLNKIVIEGSPIICNYSFWTCNIDTIILKNRIPPTAIDLHGTAYGWIDGFHEVFFEDRAYTDVQLLIPESAKDEYMSSRLWSFFSNINTFDDGYSESDSACDSINNTVNEVVDTIYYSVQECGDTIYYFKKDGIFVEAKSVDMIYIRDIYGFDGPLTPRDPMAGGLQPRVGIRVPSTDMGSVDIPESEEAEDSDSNSDEAVHYGIDGRIIPSDVSGLHIIKYKNGIEGKVWIR